MNNATNPSDMQLKLDIAQYADGVKGGDGEADFFEFKEEEEEEKKK
jgi:hypothetical protein